MYQSWFRKTSFRKLLQTSSETNTSKYFTMPDLQSLTYNKKSDLPLFHMNINSLQFYFDELETLANCPIIIIIDFQIFGIAESRLKEANPLTTNIAIKWGNLGLPGDFGQAKVY